MNGESREQAAEALARDLRARGLVRSEIIDDLVESGLTYHEAERVVDGDGLPARRQASTIRYDPQVGLGSAALDPTRPTDPGPSGVGGWLLLPALGLLLLPIRLGESAWDGISVLRGPRLEIAEAQYPGITKLVYVEIAGSAILLALALVAAYLFFTRRYTAPRAMIALLASLALVPPAIDFHAASVLGEPFDVRAALSGCMAAFVWVPYFATSVRVKNTFVH